MSRKHESLVSPALFYCFVDFAAHAPGGPFTYVVPARVVAKTLAECHQAWLSQPGKRNQQRKDSDFRRFLPDYSNLNIGKYEAGWLVPYLEAWHLLQRASV
jgi:hypothetical protein